MKKVLFTITAILFLTACNYGTKKQPEVNEKFSNTDTTGIDASVQKADEPLSKKKELLTSLIGDSKLVSIEALTGANGMVDYSKENNNWIATGSSTSEGMRESYDIEMSNSDIKKLNSMKINVSNDLTVSIICNGKTFFLTPFKEDAMEYHFKRTPKEYSDVNPKLNKNTTFIGNDLYLFARDYIPNNQIEILDIVGVMADVATISYSTEAKEFTLNLFYGECCDFSSFKFKK